MFEKKRQYRHSIKLHLGKESQVWDVLILLIESGAIYCIIWVNNHPSDSVMIF
jgi:hypothetical protein